MAVLERARTLTGAGAYDVTPHGAYDAPRRGPLGVAGRAPSPRSGVSMASVNGIARRGGPIVTTVSYHANDEIFAPGSGADTIYHVASGYVRLYKVLHDGRSINVGILGPGEYFNQDQGADDLDTGFIAEAMSDVVVELFDRAALNESIPTNPDLAVSVMTAQSRQLSALHTLVEHLLARDTGVRLATTLLQLADGFGTERADGRVIIDLPITHQSLANMIGSNRVTVTRKLLELQDTQAVVSEGRNRLSIDPEALRDVAEQL